MRDRDRDDGSRDTLPSGLTMTHHYSDGTGSVGVPTADDIAAHLLADPDLAWAVLGMVAPRVAGPWHAVEWPPRSHIRSVPPPWDRDFWSAECWSEVTESGPSGEYGATVWPGESSAKWRHAGYPTLGAAKAAADDVLRAAGYVFAGEGR